MKALHPVLAIILITIITMAAVIIVWKILSPTTRQTAETGSEQVEITQTQHIEEIDLKNLVAYCVNQPGGKYIPLGLNKEISLNIDNKKVIINPNGQEFKDTIFCIYKASINPDSPIVLAEVNLTKLGKLASKGKSIIWQTISVCFPVNGTVKFEYIDGKWICNKQ